MKLSLSILKLMPYDVKSNHFLLTKYSKNIFIFQLLILHYKKMNIWHRSNDFNKKKLMLIS